MKLQMLSLSLKTNDVSVGGHSFRVYPKGVAALAMAIPFLFGLDGTALAAAKEVRAGADSTVYGIAHENGIRTQVLINANNLKPPYTLTKGQVLRIPAPNEHIVRNGENLQTIAEDYGVKPDVLAQENDIQTPQFVKDGDTLLIPSPDTMSISEALKPPAQDISKSSLEPLPLVKSEPVCERSERVNTLTPGSAPVGLPDDLAQELAAEKGGKTKKVSTKIVDNSIDSESPTSKPNIEGNLGQAKIKRPNALASKVASSEETKEKQAPKPKKKEVKTEEKPERKIAKKEIIKEEESEEPVPVINFVWPVEGEVLSKFKPGKNDGINIQVPEGTSVKAAASGEVKYAGSELKAQGELLLIKHPDGLMTVYAHNSQLLVKKGDKVKQGQVVAKSGKTGDVKTPQLHFEVRKGKTPVDPLPKFGS